MCTSMKLLLLSFFFLSFFWCTSSTDTITLSAPLIDNQTIVSAGENFELGFFTLEGNPLSKYVGIWYKMIPVRTIVWVANRDNPLINSTGVLSLAQGQGLALTNHLGHVIWSAGSTNGSDGIIVQLLDNGNFVMMDASKDIIWQSFDYLTDTLLPGMKIGRNFKTGVEIYLNSWRSADDPSSGEYSYKLANGGPLEFILYQASRMIYSTGPCNGIEFTGNPAMRFNTFSEFEFVINPEEAYYRYTMKNKSVLTSYYGACGAFGMCFNPAPTCVCLQGFTPKVPQNWSLMDWSEGCVRRTALSCDANDKFLAVNQTKLPESSNAMVNMGMSLDDCKQSCLSNCSCRAYAAANVSDGERGCIIWNVDLVDLVKFDLNSENLYVRIAASELNSSDPQTMMLSHPNKSVDVLVAIFVIIPVVVGLILTGYCMWRKKRRNLYSQEGSVTRMGRKTSFNVKIARGRCFHGGDEHELPLLNFFVIAVATNDFSAENKLGEGGFGSVYKGKFEDGPEIAVKRLARNSRQGLDEFKNEVDLIAKLQHRNLVCLLGCCIHGEEKILVYEYMENKSLDAFIFDETKRTSLDWQTRYRIIDGIVQGLRYLHHDSRLKIIHRDLKASNILLNKDMNPKISDFGMARVFGENEMEHNTRKVVGTYGYMSPEYAMDGTFSFKSDVFSFGVLVLEILSGQRNRGVYVSYSDQNLLTYAWNLWNQGEALQLIDTSLNGSILEDEVLKCFKLGLLCIQERPEDRPLMSAVVQMLLCDWRSLPNPKQPGFTLRSTTNTGESPLSNGTFNVVTTTIIEGR